MAAPMIRASALAVAGWPLLCALDFGDLVGWGGSLPLLHLHRTNEWRDLDVERPFL
jgi:hypothetical protein